jgi:aldehyde dehydrogenase (NAD+)
MTDIYDSVFIGGHWVKADGAEVAEIFDSTSGSALGSVRTASVTQVEQAVSAARAALEDWRAQDLNTRLTALERIAEILEPRMDELSDLLTREVGQVRRIARDVQVGEPIEILRRTRSDTQAVEWTERVGNADVVREPVGVVAAITPWNYPLTTLVAKLAPALAAGCTVVVKPTEIAPLDAFEFFRAVEDAGLPPGVVNLVTGAGIDVGAALVSQPDIDMITMTGSTRAGRQIATAAAQGVKRVHLELGGKSACVVLDDADLDAAVRSAIATCLTNAGQLCVAQSRIVVPRARLTEAEEIAHDAIASTRVGDPFDDESDVGAVASSAHRDRIEEYLQIGVQEGACAIAGGPGVPDGLSGGYYVRPTVFSNADNRMRICQEEIFGPVTTLLAHDGEESALAIANDSPYGLSGAVWGPTEDVAVAAARRLRTGQVLINGGRPEGITPFGGVKESGYGHEGGRFGVEEFLVYKSLHHA